MAILDVINQVDQRVELLNQTLEHLGLPPVAALNFAGEEDAQVVYNTLVQTIRTEQQRGWYLFNRADNVTLTPNPIGMLIQLPRRAIRCVRPSTDRQSPMWRFVRQTGISPDRIDRVDGQVWAATDSIVADIVYIVDIPECAVEFLDFCAAKAAHKLAYVFNPTFDQSILRRSWDALMRVEAEATPRSNVFNDDYSTARVWFRPPGY